LNYANPYDHFFSGRLLKTEQDYDALFQAVVDIRNNLEQKIDSLYEQIRHAQLERFEATFQEQKDAFTDCLDGIDQEIVKLSVYIEEGQRLYDSLRELNEKLAELGTEPHTMPEALAGDNLVAMLMARIDRLKAEGKIPVYDSRLEKGRP
jgi:DNA repair exonuclease SbcCD ATPase subunit